MSELWQLDATALADLVAKGAASSVEVVRAHLDRIDAVNEPLNAVVRRIDESALEAAAAIDADRAAGLPLGPLAGVPFTVKENIDVAGQPTTDGLVVQADAIAAVDAPTVQHLRAAGAIPLARTNLPDMGLRVHTDSGLHGLTRNPWNTDRTAGGSSGGEAVALATGMTPLGLGNDLGGSLRNPASCCSIASIKPTSGRVATAISVPMSESSITMQLLSTEGPLARRVRDVRSALRAVARPHVRDPLAVPFPLDAVPQRPMRVALMAEPPAHSTDPRIAQVAHRAGQALAAAGAHVEVVDAPRFEETIECWRQLVSVEVKHLTPLLREVVSDDALRFFELTADSLGEATIDATMLAWMQRQALQVSWATFFQDWDAVLSPTWTQLPFEHGYDIADTASAVDTMYHARAVLPANVLGLPSAAVPGGIVDGLPVGLIVTGPAWSDMRCLHIAEIIEQAGLVPATPMTPAAALGRQPAAAS